MGFFSDPSARYSDEDWRRLRESMVEDQIRSRGVRDPRVLAAMVDVPRHEFVPPKAQSRACDDCPLSIGDGQTISQPYIVAVMLEALGLTGSERVLEIGTGSGYQTALLSLLAAQVISVERIPGLAAQAEERLARLGYQNIQIVVGDGTEGHPEACPYQGIIITAAAPDLPLPMHGQLAEGGRIVLPLGDRHEQMLVAMERHGENLERHEICACRFVPLIGRHGFRF